MDFQLIDTKINTAKQNMQTDQALLNELSDRSLAILHLYDWRGPCATYGYFVQLNQYIDEGKANQYGLSFAKRPTGGGIIFHIWDLAFSFLLPRHHENCSKNTLDNYTFVNQIVLKAVQNFLGYEKNFSLLAKDLEGKESSARFCMAKPTIYDVMFEGKKIAGAAQRKTKNGLLHQGTISMIKPSFSMLEDVLVDKTVVSLMQDHSYYLIDDESLFIQAREDLKQSLIKAVMET